MIKFCKEQWDKNSGKLKDELSTGLDWNSCSYRDLVSLVVKCIFNDGNNNGAWDTEDITVVDNGDYQGTQLFLIPANTYQPSEYQYLMTYVGYGSCSGCDTLQAIQEYGDDFLTEEQVEDFMKLCLHLVQNTIKPYNCGWREEPEFETV